MAKKEQQRDKVEYDHQYWQGRTKSVPARPEHIFQLTIINYKREGQLTFEVNEETLQYWELGKDDKRLSNAPTPILFKIQGRQFLYTKVAPERARRFRESVAMRDEVTGESTGNPPPGYAGSTGEESETDGKEGETSETQTHAGDESTAPSEPAVDEDADMDGGRSVVISSSATVRAAGASSTPVRAVASRSSEKPLLSAAQAVPTAEVVRLIFDESGSDLSSLEDDSSPVKGELSSPERLTSPAPAAIKKVALSTKKKRSSSPAPPLRQSGARPPPRATATKQTVPSPTEGSDESEHEVIGPPVKRKAAVIESDHEDYRPKVEKKIKAVDDAAESGSNSKATSSKEVARDKAGSKAKEKEKAGAKGKGGLKGKEKARERDESEPGPSKPAKQPRVNREIKSTAMQSAPRPVMMSKPSASSGADKASKDGPTKPTIIKVKRPQGDGPARSSDSAASGSTLKVPIKLPKQDVGSSTAKEEVSKLPVSSADQSSRPSSATPKPKLSAPATSTTTATPAEMDKAKLPKRSKLSASTTSSSPAVDKAAPAADVKASTADKKTPVVEKKAPAATGDKKAPAATGDKKAPAAIEDKIAPAVPAGKKGDNKVPNVSAATAAGPEAAAADTPAAPVKKTKLSASTSSSAIGKDEPAALSPAPVAAPTAVVEKSAPKPAPATSAPASKAATPAAKSSSAKSTPPVASIPKKKPDTLVKKAVTASGMSTPSGSTPLSKRTKPAQSSSNAGAAKDIVVELFGGLSGSASSNDRPRTASSIKVQMSEDEKESLERMRKEHAAEMAEFLASPGMTKPLDMENQGHVIRARQNAFIKEEKKFKIELDKYQKMSEREQAAYGPPPRPFHSSHPYETPMLCAHLLAAMDDLPEPFEGGGLAVPRNKAEASNGDFVWVEEMEGKWDEPEAVAAHLANPKYFPAEAK